MASILSNSSEYKDLILRTCLKYPKEYLTPNQLTSILLEEVNLKSDEYEYLIKDIFKFEIKVADIRVTDKKCLISKNSITEKFLNEGGFAQIHKENELKSNKVLDKEKLEKDLAISNLEANELNKKIAKQNRENEKLNKISTWINIGLGIINIALLVWQILKSE